MVRHYNIKKLVISLVVIITTILLTVSCMDKREGIIEKEEKELEGNITFVSNRTDKSDELKALIKEFEEVHPKVKINLELIGDAENILQRKVALGELADVTLVPSIIGSSDYNKYFLSLDELGFSEENIYNYYSGIGSDGKLYSLTTSLKWLGIVYNKKVFENATVDSIPITIPDFMKACEKIKSIGVTPIALNYTEAWAIGVWIDEIPYVLDEDLEYDIMKNSKDVLSRDTGTYKSLKFVSEILEKGYCEDDLLNYKWEQCKTDFIEGKVAMIPFSSNLRYQFEDIGMNKEDIGMFPIPESEVLSITGDYKFAVSKNTQYPEVAKEFFKFLFEDDRYANAVNIVSTLKSSAENIRITKELETFSLPIQMHENVVKDKSDDSVKEHDDYYNIRKSIGMNVEFIQKYLMSENRAELIDTINEKWINERDGK